MKAICRTKHAGTDYAVEVMVPEKPFLEAEGKWDNRSSRYLINMSSILTKLIQETGRWCEHYASDLFYMYSEIEKKLGEYDEDGSVSYGFAMHESGVHDAYEAAYNTQNLSIHRMYRAVWGILINRHGMNIKAGMYRIERISVESDDDLSMPQSVADWETRLAGAKHGHDISPVIGYGFTKHDIWVLACLHKEGKHRERIEELLTDCNFHAECGSFATGSYDEYI